MPLACYWLRVPVYNLNMPKQALRGLRLTPGLHYIDLALG